jgi:hypothetical protein
MRHTKHQKKYRHTFIYKSEKKASIFVKVSLQKKWWLSRGHVIDVTLVSGGTPVEKHCFSAIFPNIFTGRQLRHKKTCKTTVKLGYKNGRSRAVSYNRV